MHPSAPPLAFASVPTASNRLAAERSARTHRPIADGLGPPVTPLSASPSPALAETCRREVRARERSETTALLFVTGCAMAVIAGCAFHLERGLANWSSLESFVRAALF